MGIPATREWVSALVSKSLRAATGGGDKPPKALSELTDVVVAEPSNDDALIWDEESQMWKNKKVPEGTKNYNDLNNKPSINGQKLVGDITIKTGGTEVEANPTDPATEELKKIKIGENVFSIPEGGGGGGSSDYVEYDEETETIKFKEISGGSGSPKHKYSTEEQIVGEWIDGKPIYEKSFMTSKQTNTSTSVWVNFDEVVDENMLCVIDVELYYKFGDRWCQYIPTQVSDDNGHVSILCQTSTQRTILMYTVRYLKSTD